MKQYKYNLQTILLYLQNKLSSHEANEVSVYLSQNKEFFDYIIKLVKINSRILYTQNEISFINKCNVLQSCVTGALELIETKSLAFRGNSESYLYKYLFKDLILSLIRHIDNSWLLRIETEDIPKKFMLIDANCDYLCQELINHQTIFHLSQNTIYMLFYYLDDKVDSCKLIMPIKNII